MDLNGTLSLMDLSLTGTLSRPEKLCGCVCRNINAAGTISSAFYRGWSAYEIAVANGFEGTEEEWLAQLIGNGIASAVLNPDYTLTLTFTDGTSYTTPPIRGEKGEQGIQGIQGIQGEQGHRGYSAYEVAVQHGFVGTEEEWLASIASDQATNALPGIMKLYDQMGQNTDGTMTQRSITNAIVDCQNKSISTDDLLEILI